MQIGRLHEGSPETICSLWDAAWEGSGSGKRALASPRVRAGLEACGQGAGRDGGARVGSPDAQPARKGALGMDGEEFTLRTMGGQCRDCNRSMRAEKSFWRRILKTK